MPMREIEVWDQIPERKLTNCLKKVGISKKSAERTVNDDDDSFRSEIKIVPSKNLEASLQTLKQNLWRRHLFIN